MKTRCFWKSHLIYVCVGWGGLVGGKREMCARWFLRPKNLISRDNDCVSGETSSVIITDCLWAKRINSKIDAKIGTFLKWRSSLSPPRKPVLIFRMIYHARFWIGRKKNTIHYSVCNEHAIPWNTFFATRSATKFRYFGPYKRFITSPPSPPTVTFREGVVRALIERIKFPQFWMLSRTVYTSKVLVATSRLGPTRVVVAKYENV